VVGIPSDGVRDLPDVSLFASGGNGPWGHFYVFCYSDRNNGGTPCTGAPIGWSLGGGTSFASPIMAGIQALVNQYATPITDITSSLPMNTARPAAAPAIRAMAIRFEARAFSTT
jgi:hypothetical protein